jgi:hypothetical protein
MASKSARKVILVVGVLFLLVAAGLAVLLVSRWREAQAYESAPACSADAAARGDSGGCKLVTDGEFQKVTCESAKGTTACNFFFQVAVKGKPEVHGAYLAPGFKDRFKPGDRTKVELYDGHITKVATSGDKLPDEGRPESAASYLIYSVVAALVLGAFLVWAGLRRDSFAP